MLQKIGDAFTTQKWLTYLLFGALSVIFAAWGAYGIASLQFNASSNAAKVNGVGIPYSQIQSAWMQQQAEWEQRVGGAMPPAVKTQLESQLLEEFVRDTLMAQRTRELGYRISTDELAQAIRQDPAFQLEGQYSAALAKLRLQQAGITEQAYEQNLSQSLRVEQLEDGIRESEFLTPVEVNRIESLESEEREAQYAVLPAAQFASPAPVPEASIEAYYDAHRAEFMTPETVDLQYAELDLPQVLASTQVSDEDLKSYYEKHKAQFVTPERRRARHILIAVSAQRSAAAALARANEVLAKLKAGARFAQLAKQYSDDPGSASQGGELGWNEATAFTGPMAPFGKALFSMKAGTVSGPVRTQYGYHIIELQGIEPGKTQTLAQVRPTIEPIVRRQEAGSRFSDIQEQIQEQLDEGAPSLPSLAKTFGMHLGEVQEFVRGKGGAPLGNSRDLESAVFSGSVLNEHHVGGPVPLGSDRMVLVSDLAHHLPALKPLAEVRATIVAALQSQRANEAALAAAKAAVHSLDSGTSLAALAQTLKVPVGPVRYVGRDDPSVPAAIRGRIFGAPQPSAGKPVYRAFALPSGGAAVVVVTAVKLDAPRNPERMQSLIHRILADDGARAIDDYVAQARLKAKVQTNLQVFQ